MRKVIALFALVFMPFLVLAQTTSLETQKKILNNISQIEQDYMKYLSAAELKEAIILLNETRSLVIGGFENSDDSSGQLKVLSDLVLADLIAQIKKEPSDKAKTRIVLSIGKNGKIFCYQVEKIIQTYSWDDDRSELLRQIADNIADPVNIGVVGKYYTSSHRRDEIIAFFQNR